MTKTELEVHVKCLYHDHGEGEIAKKLGISKHRVRLTITNLQRRGELIYKRPGKDNREHAFYQGEDLVAIGTLDEITEETGIGKARLKHYRSPAYQKMHKRGRAVVVLEEDE